MNTYVALLRGVNLAGNKKVIMSELRDLCTSVGLVDVRSLLQSGNLVFRSDVRDGARLEHLLQSAAEKELGLATEFFVRTAKELTAIIAGNPFPEMAKNDPSHLVVVALKDAPPAAGVKALQAAITGPEIVRAGTKHLYITYPAGIGDSRLTAAVIDKALATRGTGRNWNTIGKLAALATS